MHLHTGTHVVEQLFGMSVNMDTLFTTWLTAIIVFIAVFAATRGRSLIPGGWQNVIEMVIEGLCSQFESNVGSKYRQVATVLLTLFLFIFTANQIGLLPTEHLTASPTNDVNTTLGLAIAGSLITHFYFQVQRVWTLGFPFLQTIPGIRRHESARRSLQANYAGYASIRQHSRRRNSAGNPVFPLPMARTYDLDRRFVIHRSGSGIHFHHPDICIHEGKRRLTGIRKQGKRTAASNRYGTVRPNGISTWLCLTNPLGRVPKHFIIH